MKTADRHDHRRHGQGRGAWSTLPDDSANGADETGAIKAERADTAKLRVRISAKVRVRFVPLGSFRSEGPLSHRRHLSTVGVRSPTTPVKSLRGSRKAGRAAAAPMPAENIADGLGARRLGFWACWPLEPAEGLRGMKQTACPAQSRPQRSMPYMLAAAPATPAIPMTFATRRPGTRSAPFSHIAARRSRGGWIYGQARGLAPLCPTRMARSRIWCSAWGRDPQIPRSVQARALPGLLPPGVYRFANARKTRASLRSPLRRLLRFGRYRKSDTARRQLVPPDGVDIAAISRMAEAATLPATSSTRRPTTWDRKNWRWRRKPRRALRRQIRLHRRRGSAATEFSADPCGRDGITARPAPNRSDLGRSRLIPR